MNRHHHHITQSHHGINWMALNAIMLVLMLRLEWVI
jgi:hypothetical protein